MNTTAAIAPAGAKSAQDGNDRKSALISPLADFFLVGGITFFLLPFAFLPSWQSLPPERLLFISLLLSFVVNYPHFMHSYQLLYTDYTGKLRAATPGGRFRLLIAGIISPTVLLVFFAYGLMQDTLIPLNHGVTIMVFLVGWHYVKQGFGTMMVLSGRKGVFFSKLEKTILLYNAYAVWIWSWMGNNFQLIRADAVNHATKPMFLGVAGSNIYFPEPLIAAAFFAAMALTAASTFVFLKTWFVNQKISVNGMVAYYSAIYFWMGVLALRLNINYLILTPMLHSLQYLPFVWKICFEKARERYGDENASRKIALFQTGKFVATGIFLGVMFFIAIPKGLDHVLAFKTHAFGTAIFLYSFGIFINLHHYFIDYAIWRRDNPEMKYLFR